MAMLASAWLLVASIPVAAAAAAAVTGRRLDLKEVLRGRVKLADANYAWFVQSSYQVR